MALQPQELPRQLTLASLLVPVPEVSSPEALNQTLVEHCRADLDILTRGKAGPKKDLLVEDQAAFLRLPKQPFEARRIAQSRAIGYGPYKAVFSLPYLHSEANPAKKARSSSGTGRDNNASERALKRVAIGRKNWLFAGHDAAAENHARLWSLIASAERHAIDPQQHLTSILAKLPLLSLDAHTPDPAMPVQFLPDVWKRDDAAEPHPA